ncbi:hypothetical protein Tco_0282331 [Tanacetum coccineum]
MPALVVCSCSKLSLMSPISAHALLSTGEFSPYVPGRYRYSCVCLCLEMGLVCIYMIMMGLSLYLHNSASSVDPSIDSPYGHMLPYLRNALAGPTQVSLIPYPTSLIPCHLASASTGQNITSFEDGARDSGISSLWSTGGGMYRDGGSGGSGGDSNETMMVVMVNGTSGGDECAGGAMHLARRSPAEGGDSEIGGDGVVMARSLSTSASGGSDIGSF